MKPDLDRLRSDLETVRSALGLSPRLGPDWIRWMRRDFRLNVWWLLPAALLAGSAAFPHGGTGRVLGLVPAQWLGLAVAVVLLGMLALWNRAVTSDDGRPEGLVRWYRDMGRQAWKWGAVLLLQLALWGLWARQHDVTGAAIGSGIWVLTGTSLVQLAVTARMWGYLGWALPLVIWGLCQSMIPSGRDGWVLGVVIAVATLLSSVIHACQLRAIERGCHAD